MLSKLHLFGVVALMTWLHSLQTVHAESNCTFKEIEKQFVANVSLVLKTESEEQCMRVCYEESRCTFINFVEGLCTIFKAGDVKHKPDRKTFRINREIANKTCTRKVEIGRPRSFQPIPVDNNEDTACSGEPSSFTFIYQMMYSTGGRRFYTNDKSLLPNEESEATKAFKLASSPQPHCTSVPVFTRANHRRLYFGSVYNTTGYIFMNAYAFASACACEGGTCCGRSSMREYYMTDFKDYIYWPEADALLEKYTNFTRTEVNQTFYIVDMDTEI